jgi:hypothetical protein
MRLSHARRAISVRFDDPNLVSCAGLVPVMALAERCGLTHLLVEHVKIAVKGGVNAAVKIRAVIAGMVCGADSIDDLDLLRHGGMPRLFDQIRAPSTLGTFLRLFTFGHVRQLDAVAARLLAALARAVPLLPGADRFVLVDIDDTVRQTFGYAKQGAGRGYTGVKGLNALLATVSTTGAAPLIAAARLRKGSTNSARGAARVLTDALATARRAGAAGTVLVRADSAYYGADIAAAARRAGARFSVTARLTPTVVKAITSIDEQAWVPIRYPNAIFDPDEQRWISDAEVAETTLTACDGSTRRRYRPGRPKRRRLPPPRDLHRHRRADAGRGSHPPRPRHHRTSHRRAEERAAGPPAVREVHGQRRLAGLRHPGVQPHPRRRCPRRHRPRPDPHRDRGHPADPHSGPHGALRASTAAAPTPGLALGTRAPRAVPPRPARPPPHRSLTTTHQGPTGDQQWNSRANRRPHPAHRSTPTSRDQLHRSNKINGGTRLSLDPPLKCAEDAVW